MTHTDNKALQPGAFFAMTFILCTISAVTALSYIPDVWWVAWRDLTMLVSEGVGRLFGIATSSQADVLTVNGFAMRIIRQCTAVDYVVILSTAMLLYVRHSLSYRLLGLAIAVPLILIANACRLIITGLVGAFSRRAFDFTHDYLWVIAFALIVFAIWTQWVNGRFSISCSAARRVAVVVSVSLAAYVLLTVFHTTYGSLLAHLSSLFYRLGNDDPQGSIIRVGDAMVYSRGAARYSLGNLVEEVNVAIYLGLMVPLQKRGDAKMLGMTLFGLLLIIATSAIFVALGCSQAVASGMVAYQGFLSIGSIVQLAMPMTMLWLMASERERDERLLALKAGACGIGRSGRKL